MARDRISDLGNDVRRLAVFPVYRDNPYLNLMLLAPRAAGWRVSESASLDRFEHDVLTFGARDVVHVHWTAPIVQRADTTAEAEQRLRRFRRTVDGARARGAAVLWTVHNALPHDVRYRAPEVELNRYLAATANVVHVLNSRTAEVVREDYELNEQAVVHIPHPSYRGVYEGGLSRQQARQHFGIDDDEVAVLFFGQVRPYKGVDVLIDALRRTASNDRFVLLLAGKTTPEDETIIDQLLPDGLRTIREHAFVDDAEVERWFVAADIAVLPYRRILNSGSLHLAATFGIPTVLPDEPHLRSDFGDERWVYWFEPGDPSDLARVLTSGPFPRGVSRSFADRVAPFSVSRLYAELLSSMVSNMH